MAKQQNSRVRRMRLADVQAVETAILTARAIGHETIAYETLQAILGGVSAPVLWGMLNLSVDEALQHERPVLAAMAVGRSGIPGRGFFDRLRKNGLNLPHTPEAEQAAWEVYVGRIYSTPTEHL